MGIAEVLGLRGWGYSLEEAVGRRVILETIEGTDPEAWEREKARREMAIQQAQTAHESRLVKGAQIVWLDLYEEIGKTFGSARERRFPLSRARTLIKTLKLAVEAEEKARAEEPDNEELHPQQLNRTIDRIATFAELPGTMVGVDYLRAQQGRVKDVGPVGGRQDDYVGIGLEPVQFHQPSIESLLPLVMATA